MSFCNINKGSKMAKEKEIKVIVWDATKKELYQSKVGNYKDYYNLIGCSTFDVVRVGNNLSIYVDDEGLFVENPLTIIAGLSHPLAGNLVFTGGIDNRGNTLSCPLKMTDVKEMIIGIARFE
jgi:hypothetical protein